jgi:hypothetical protein
LITAFRKEPRIFIEHAVIEYFRFFRNKEARYHDLLLQNKETYLFWRH